MARSFASIGKCPENLRCHVSCKLLLPTDTAFAQGEFDIGALQTALAQLFANPQQGHSRNGRGRKQSFQGNGLRKAALLPSNGRGLFRSSPPQRRADAVCASARLDHARDVRAGPWRFAARRRGYRVRQCHRCFRCQCRPVVFSLFDWQQPWTSITLESAACHAFASQASRRFPGCPPGTWPSWPCPDRSCCRCRHTRRRTSRRNRAARPGRSSRR